MPIFIQMVVDNSLAVVSTSAAHIALPTCFTLTLSRTTYARFCHAIAMTTKTEIATIAQVRLLIAIKWVNQLTNRQMIQLTMETRKVTQARTVEK